MTEAFCILLLDNHSSSFYNKSLQLDNDDTNTAIWQKDHNEGQKELSYMIEKWKLLQLKLKLWYQKFIAYSGT